ncbi:adenylate/guanylate cyclase domain-containing protein [Variovorax sp. J22P168]|uniref:ATP-binding protein n=1 Tax=Variovorax jilinensis TaxID=3053513 RepID=UPI002575453F|nr:adenylate/guanylate cyclase domain-containing protein [Variovorax sp. J22P168]MDM0012457.1 adenylate/guanylate cyclase domain-containing protein [Variovorax sp. J22P168]
MFALCPRCAAESRAGARFCDQCGTALPSTTIDRPELRQGTMLFCDLVQSTRLANALDPDDLRLVFSSIHRVVREVSRRHSGYIIRFVGDGAFVVFGYPAVQEDSAESAVRAGIDFVHSIKAVRAPPPATLELRVGIASGTVVMGEMIAGAAIDEQSVTGPVAHLAARLVASAPPSGVVLCEQTRRLVGQRFELRALGPLRLDGFPQPVPAWQAFAELPSLSRFEALRTGRGASQLVGREGLLAELATLWRQVSQGSCEVVELVGEAGVGKSRLVRALQQSLAEEQAMHLDLHCTPRMQNAPLYPLGVLLRRLADVQPGDDEAGTRDKTLLLLAATIAGPAPDNAWRYLRPVMCPQAAVPSEGDSPELERENTVKLLVWLMRALTQRSPVLLIVEDLHWADATTGLVLRRVIEDAAGQRLMILVARRSDAGAFLDGLPRVVRKNLEPLDADEAAKLVRSLAAGDALSDSAVDGIVERGEGNPLFLEELTRAVIEKSTGSGDEIPATLQHLVQARLDRLPALRAVVQSAAVLGREFSPLLLERLTGEPRDMAAPIGRLIEEGILIATSAASYGALRFRHALIHDAVYHTLLRGDRQRLHARAAELLQTNEGRAPGEVPLDLLAHHFAQAGQTERAVRTLIDASRLTAGRAAYEESIGHAQAGLKLTAQIAEPSASRSLRRALLSQLGHSFTATRGYVAPEVEHAFTEAMSLCDEETPPEDAYPVYRGSGSHYLVRGRIVRSYELAQACIRMAEQSGRLDLLIDALAFAAYPLLYLGRLDEGQQHLDRCLSLYKAEKGSRFTYPNVQEPGTAAWSMVTTIAWLRGDLRAAEDAADALHAHLETLHSPFDHSYGKVWMAASRLLQRRFANAAELASNGLAVAQERGYSTWIPAGMMQLCIAQGALGPAPEAVATLQFVHKAFLDAGAEVSATYYTWGIAMSLLAAEDRAGALAMVQSGLQRAADGEEVYMAGELHILMARLADNPADARAHLLQAMAHARSHGALTVALRAAAMLLCLLDADGLRDAAQMALEVLDGTLPVPDDPDFVRLTLVHFEAAIASLTALALTSDQPVVHAQVE